uniref:Phenylalanine ammonia lyase 2 n=1 Tax=Elaeis guineensis var. tenera TaxID=51953 RepID=A0A0R6IIB2_ELAGV|nr:phenylalanine ammonia lyase 2 [Elaeis guineensis]
MAFPGKPSEPNVCIHSHPIADSASAYISDPYHWKKAAETLSSAYFDEVRRMITQFSELTSICLQGTTSLTVAQVAAITRRSSVTVTLDAATARARVDRSAAWVAEHSNTAGFGASSHRRTNKTGDLQAELIRFLNAGVIGADPFPSSYTKAAMLVRTNTLMQGYSGVRWELLEAMSKLMNQNLIPKIPLRGSICELLPLSYIAGVLIGRDNSLVTTLEGREITSMEALKRVGIDRPFELHSREGIALVNGTALGSAVAAAACYDANILAILAVILSAIFCEAMRGRPEFADPLTHELKHHPGQIESAAIMKYLLEGSDYMKEAELRRGREPPTKPKQDRYALRTSPQWLGPQIELIRMATHSIEREINSVDDNPLVDISRGVFLRGGNFQGTPIDVSMDSLRIALAAIGKLIFAQFSELVCDYYNDGLPSNLSAGADPSLDYGFKGAEIAMAAYCSELQYLANPVTAHVQSAEQNNQDVNSLGLIAARKSVEAVEILRLMMATYMVALCQAIDLRQLEENLREVVKQAVVEAARKVLDSAEDGSLSEARFWEKDLIQVVERLPVYSYIDDPGNAKNALMQQLREALVEKALEGNEEGRVVFKRISEFQEEARQRSREEVERARERFRKGDFVIGSRINKCRTYPMYKFVREEVGTELLTGEKKVSPGEYIEKVYEAMKERRVGKVVVECIDGSISGFAAHKNP